MPKKNVLLLPFFLKDPVPLFIKKLNFAYLIKTQTSNMSFYKKKLHLTGSLGISLSAHKFCQFHTSWGTYLFVKYVRQTKVSSIPSCGKQQEREGVQCCWQHGDPKKSLPRTKERRSLRYCKIQLWSVKRHGLLK